MNRFTKAAAAAFFMLAIWVPIAGSALALPVCMDRGVMAARLLETFGEKVVAWGLSHGRLVEIYANPDHASFTITTTNARGLACVSLTGQDWRQVDPEPQDQAA